MSSTKNLQALAVKFARFVLVGLSGTVVNLGVLWLLVEAGMVTWAASLAATEVAIINNFIWHNLWTFRAESQLSRQGIVPRLIAFQLVSTITAALTFCLFLMLHNVLGLHYLLAQFFSIATATVLNFTANSWLTWGVLGKEQPLGRTRLPLSRLRPGLVEESEE